MIAVIDSALAGFQTLQVSVHKVIPDDFEPRADIGFDDLSQLVGFRLDSQASVDIAPLEVDGKISFLSFSLLAVHCLESVIP